VWLRSFGETTVSVRLLVPYAWKVRPVSTVVNFTGKGDESRVTFTVTPPEKETVDNMLAEVELKSGKKITLGLTDIQYQHIPAQRIFGDSGAKLVRADIRHTGSRIGYIMGSGDDVPSILRQIGYEVTPVTDADLDRGDFSAYDAVITGVRAYNTRKRLRLAHEKLMQYVEKGGTMVVQYNTLDDLAVAAPGPYPFKISRDRVTVEEAPVKLLDPAHPLLTAPNKIAATDFNGWVQERGLYFASEWDPKYTTILASNDPGETEKPGGELYAPRTEQDVVAAFAEIAGKIRRGYTLGYTPTNSAHDGTYRKLIVRALVPGMRPPVVHVRDGYLSPLHPNER